MTLRESDELRADSNHHIPSDFRVFVDSYEVNALVDRSVDYSVISSELTKTLNKVLTPRDSPQVHTAGEHLIYPIGACTARVGIRGFTYVASFIVLPECFRAVIVKTDFLEANGAVYLAGIMLLIFNQARTCNV